MMALSSHGPPATYKQVKKGRDWNRSSPLWVQWALQHWVLLCLFGAVMTNALQNSSAWDRHRASMLPIRDSAAAKEKPSDWYITNTSKLQYWSHKFHSLRKSVYEKNAKTSNLNGRGSKIRTNNLHKVLHIMLLEFHNLSDHIKDSSIVSVVPVKALVTSSF